MTSFLRLALKTFKKYWYKFLTPISFVSGIYHFGKKDYFLAFLLFTIVPILLYLPKKVLIWNNATKSETLLKMLKNLAATMFFLPLFGGLYFYRSLSFYDGLIHIVVSALISFIIAIALSIGWPFKNRFNQEILKNGKINFMRLAILSLLLTILGGALWELFEKTSDTYFNTHLFKDYFDPITTDTIEDLIGDFIGATLGAIYIWKRGEAWKNYFMDKNKKG